MWRRRRRQPAGRERDDDLFGEGGNDTLRGEGGPGDLCVGGLGTDVTPLGSSCESSSSVP